MKRENELNLVRLGQIISDFLTKPNEKPKMDRYNRYYNGKMAIMSKLPTSDNKPCNRIVVNFLETIVSTYLGYLTGRDISYQSDKDFENIQNILNYNDIHNEDSQLLEDALIYGRAVEINYVDSTNQQRFTTLDPRTAFPIYDDTLNADLLYGVRVYSVDYAGTANDEYIVEVYDDKVMRKYKSTQGFSSFSLLEEQPHYFKQVPLTFFDLNRRQDSIFDKVMDLNDAYNATLSSEIDDWESFCDSYLLFRGAYLDADEIDEMRKMRAFCVDADATAEYLTKQVNDTQVLNMLENMNDKIHKISNTPDFTSEKFLSQSGIALRYKLIGFNNKAGAIEAKMRKALQRRLELISSVEGVLHGESMETWRDVNIIFNYNLPEDITENVEIVNKLRGVVSDETLLSLLPFVKDVDAEMERITAQREASMSMYSFTSGDDEEEDLDE